MAGSTTDRAGNPRYWASFPFEELTPIDFDTGLERPPLDDLETVEGINSNNHFPLWYFLPNRHQEAGRRHLVVMINGFDEKPASQRLYYGKDYSISRVLGGSTQNSSNAKSSFSTVLLPIPFHHWRLPTIGELRKLDAAHLIARHKIRLFLGYQQLVHDADKLIGDVQTGNSEFYSKNFGSETIIHLLGYSLGGLAALAIFLRDQIRGRPLRISTCSLLASGVSLPNASFKLIDLDLDQIAAIKNYYVGAEFREQLGSFVSMEDTDNKLIVDLFHKIVLGSNSLAEHDANRIAEIWKQSKHQIPIITGENEDVMDPSFMYAEFPTGAVHMHTTALGVKHTLATEPAWRQTEAHRTLTWARDIMERATFK